MFCASLFEGCCNATIEALNNSKIILSSDCPGGNREIILNGRGGELFLNNNFKSLARSMKLIINNLPKQIKKQKWQEKIYTDLNYKTINCLMKIFSIIYEE